jgi:hypothetical protein
MAAKKKKAVKRRPRVRRVRLSLHRRSRTPAEAKWRLWNHDLDSILHELVKNPALSTSSPEEIIALAERFADAYRAMIERRRPSDVPDDFE